VLGLIILINGLKKQVVNLKQCKFKRAFLGLFLGIMTPSILKIRSLGENLIFRGAGYRTKYRRHEDTPFSDITRRISEGFIANHLFATLPSSRLEKVARDTLREMLCGGRAQRQGRSSRSPGGRHHSCPSQDPRKYSPTLREFHQPPMTGFFIPFCPESIALEAV